MANAKKCDRCGKYYEEREATPIETLAHSMEALIVPKTVMQNISVIERILDLCPSCSESLKRWANGKENAEDGN